MKKTINYLLVSMLFILALGSCNKETDTSIYAPNNALVSESMEDLTKTLANIVNMDAKDLSIESISYLDVKEGFIAEVEMHISTTNEYFNLFYVSPIYKDRISYDSSIVVSESAEQRNAPYIEDFPGLYCSCWDSSAPSNQCRISGRLGESGIPYFRCTSTGCSNVCELQAN